MDPKTLNKGKLIIKNMPLELVMLSLGVGDVPSRAGNGPSGSRCCSDLGLVVHRPGVGDDPYTLSLIN